MGLLTRIEALICSIVEAPFGGATAFNPANIEIGIRREIERRKRYVLGKFFVPNLFRIITTENVLREHQPFVEEFAARIVESLAMWIHENGYLTVDRVNVDFEGDVFMHDSFLIRASFLDRRQDSVESGCGQKQNRASLVNGFPNIDKNKGDSYSAICLSGSEKQLCVTNEGGNTQHAMVLINVSTGLPITIENNYNTIGRALHSTIRICNDTVSEDHASLTVTLGKAVLEDRGSRNGTRINHKKIRRALLNDNDKIEFGDAEYVLKFNKDHEPRTIIQSCQDYV